MPMNSRIRSARDAQGRTFAWVEPAVQDSNMTWSYKSGLSLNIIWYHLCVSLFGYNFNF